jgi:hypothetical protein
MLNDESVLQTDRGKVIGFGRVKVPKMPKLGFDYEIPLLSFVVIKRNEESGYIASCIHLQVDGYGADSTGACHDMISSILFYLRENFKHVDCIDDAWDNLYELSVSNPLSGILWDKYHALQYRLAKRGVSTDRYSLLDGKIQSLQDEVYKLEAKLSDKESELEDREARYSELWDSYLHEITKSKLMGSMIIEERVI